MPIPLPEYEKIKDNYCIAYFGSNKEHLIQLKLLRPLMEKTFPGVKVYIACREDHLYLLDGEERIISKLYLTNNRNMFGYIRELVWDMDSLSHPVEDFINESEIIINPIDPLIPVEKNNIRKCVLLTNGVFPVKSLSANQIKLAISHIQSKGIEVEMNGQIEFADWVVGVENEYLYQAANLGKRITLIPSGFGENLLKKMFPSVQILNLEA